MASRSAPKTRVSNAWTGARDAPQGKERRAHAAKKNLDPHRRAPVELALPSGRRGKATTKGRQDLNEPVRAHHQGGGAKAQPAWNVKRRSIEHRVPVPPPQRQRRRRRAAAGE